MIVKHKRTWGVGVAGVAALAVTALIVIGDIGGVGAVRQCVDRPVAITAIAIVPGYTASSPAVSEDSWSKHVVVTEAQVRSALDEAPIRIDLTNRTCR